MPARRFFAVKCLTSKTVRQNVFQKRTYRLEGKMPMKNKSTLVHNIVPFYVIPTPTPPRWCANISPEGNTILKSIIKLLLDKYLHLADIWSHSISTMSITFRVPVLKYHTQTIKISTNMQESSGPLLKEQISDWVFVQSMKTRPLRILDNISI